MRGFLCLLLGLAAAAPLNAQVERRLPGRPAPRDTAVRQDTARRAAATDTIFERLLKLPGYTPIEYRGDSAEYRADTRVLRLRGSSEVVRQGERLTATDSIVYQEGVRSARAFGQPKVVGGSAPEITGNSMRYDFATGRASVQGARTTFTQGATWYVYDSNATTEGTSHVYVNGGKFTSCDLEVPHYHFESDKIMFIRDRIIVARPARLYFANVPVLWIPFVVQDLARGRRSGILTPRFGFNDIVRQGGRGRRIENVGYYWAISDYLGAEVSTAWDSRAYTALTGGLQYNWRRQQLNGSLSYSQYWRETGGRETGLTTSNSWRPDERTQIGLQGQYFSSSQFVRDVSTDPREPTQDLASTFSLSRRLDWGSLAVQGSRRQSVATGRVETQFPSGSLVFNPITLFGGATLSLSASGSHTSTDEPDEPSQLSRLRDRDVTQLQASQSLTFGRLSLSSSGSLNRQLLAALLTVDSTLSPAARGIQNRQEGSWQTSISYQQNLIGSTYIAPFAQLSQQIVRDDTLSRRAVSSASVADQLRGRFTGGAPVPMDTVVFGRYVSAPIRQSFGASVNTDMYGFFPGVGPYSRLRHHFKPTFSYSYVPEVQQTREQELVFGRAGGRTQNLLTFGMTNTFEAKLREVRTPQATDTLNADTSAAARARAQPPADPGKVVLLSISTSSVQYDFVRALEEGNGFTTPSISNTITSDYLRGLNVSVSHDLFDRTNTTRPGEPGRFSPFLTSVNTGFSFGETSALFRFLGLGRREENIATPDAGGVVPGPNVSTDPLSPRGPGSFNNNPQPVGRGPWNVRLDYTLHRARPIIGQPLGFTGFNQNTQDIRANVSFSPTRNWAVDWSTSYEVNSGQFGSHYVRVRRDLHRWQANFDFQRTITGNTSFNFYVFLIDNQDLKAEYRESNIGGQRR